MLLNVRVGHDIFGLVVLERRHTHLGARGNVECEVVANTGKRANEQRATHRVGREIDHAFTGDLVQRVQQA